MLVVVVVVVAVVVVAVAIVFIVVVVVVAVVVVAAIVFIVVVVVVVVAVVVVAAAVVFIVVVVVVAVVRCCRSLLICGQTYTRHMDSDCLSALATLGSSVHKVCSSHSLSLPDRLSRLSQSSRLCKLSHSISQWLVLSNTQFMVLHC